MDSNERQHTITISSGRSLTFRECSFRILTDFENEGFTMQDIADGKMTAFAKLAWMMCRGDAANPDPTWDQFLDEFTLEDFHQHQPTLKAFFQAPLESGGETATG